MGHCQINYLTKTNYLSNERSQIMSNYYQETDEELQSENKSKSVYRNDNQRISTNAKRRPNLTAAISETRSKRSQQEKSYSIGNFAKLARFCALNDKFVKRSRQNQNGF